jgi:hypothetical protein
VIRNAYFYNLDTAIRFGAAPSAGNSYQADAWIVENILTTVVNTGVHVNGFNACQGGTIRNCRIYHDCSGVYIELGSLVTITNTVFANRVVEDVGLTYAHIRLHQGYHITIEQCQGESELAYLPSPPPNPYVPFLRLTGSTYNNSVAMRSCWNDTGVVFADGSFSNRLEMSGCHHAADVDLGASANNQVISSGDRFDDGIGILDSGTNNLIKEISPYYATSGVEWTVSERETFNQGVTYYRTSTGMITSPTAANYFLGFTTDLIDLGLPANTSDLGGTSIVSCSAVASTGDATTSEVFMVRVGYDGDHVTGVSIGRSEGAGMTGLPTWTFEVTADHTIGIRCSAALGCKYKIVSA